MATDDFKNFRISFWNRVHAQLAGSYSVKYEGLDFDTDAQTQWMEPNILNGNSLSRRASTRNESWLCQVDIYSKTGRNQATPVSIWDLVGAVRDAFDQVTFALQDWDGTGDPTVGYVICGPMDAQPLQTNDDHLMRVVCTFNCRINA